MEDQTTPINEVFLDTAFAIALSSPKDTHHEQAVKLSEQLERDGTLLITTRAVVIEIGNALAKQPFRAAAIELIESLKHDPNTRTIPVSEDLANHVRALSRTTGQAVGNDGLHILCRYAGQPLEKSADHRPALSASWIPSADAD